MKNKKNKFRTDTSTNVEPTIIHLHEKYQFECYSFREIGKSRSQLTFLTIAALKPEIKSWPEFTFRWDEKMDELDVDILNVADDVERMFKKGKKGYKGHHTEPIRDCTGKRIFEILIEIPQKGKILKIFQGCITIALCRGLLASVRIKSLLRASLKVIH